MMRESTPGMWLLFFAAQVVVILLIWGKNLERVLRFFLRLLPGR